jgi:hypothetical protein
MQAVCLVAVSAFMKSYGTPGVTLNRLRSIILALIYGNSCKHIENNMFCGKDRSRLEATSKPNASTIRELDEYVHKICTRGLGMELNF